MKLKLPIVEETSPDENSAIVIFENDKNKKHFEVKCSFNPFVNKMRKWDSWEMVIKWDSEIFTDAKTGNKSYFTFCKSCGNNILFNDQIIISNKFDNLNRLTRSSTYFCIRIFL